MPRALWNHDLGPTFLEQARDELGSCPVRSPAAVGGSAAPACSAAPPHHAACTPARPHSIPSTAEHVLLPPLRAGPGGGCARAAARLGWACLADPGAAGRVLAAAPSLLRPPPPLLPAACHPSAPVRRRLRVGRAAAQQQRDGHRAHARPPEVGSRALVRQGTGGGQAHCRSSHVQSTPQLQPGLPDCRPAAPPSTACLPACLPAYRPFPSSSRSWRVTGGVLDVLLLAGPTPLAVLDQLTAVVGRPAMQPRWALGWHQVRPPSAAGCPGWPAPRARWARAAALPVFQRASPRRSRLSLPRSSASMATARCGRWRRCGPAAGWAPGVGPGSAASRAFRQAAAPTLSCAASNPPPTPTTHPPARRRWWPTTLPRGCPWRSSGPTCAALLGRGGGGRRLRPGCQPSCGGPGAAAGLARPPACPWSQPPALPAHCAPAPTADRPHGCLEGGPPGCLVGPGAPAARRAGPAPAPLPPFLHAGLHLPPQELPAAGDAGGGGRAARGCGGNAGRARLRQAKAARPARRTGAPASSCASLPRRLQPAPATPSRTPRRPAPPPALCGRPAQAGAALGAHRGPGHQGGAGVRGERRERMGGGGAGEQGGRLLWAARRGPGRRGGAGPRGGGCLPGGPASHGPRPLGRNLRCALPPCSHRCTPFARLSTAVRRGLEAGRVHAWH